MSFRPIDIAHEYFPDAGDDELDHIIWSRTGFPEFWHIPKDGATPEACFRTQLRDEANRRKGYRRGYLEGVTDAFAIPIESEGDFE